MNTSGCMRPSKLWRGLLSRPAFRLLTSLSWALRQTQEIVRLIAIRRRLQIFPSVVRSDDDPNRMSAYRDKVALGIALDVTDCLVFGGIPSTYERAAADSFDA